MIKRKVQQLMRYQNIKAFYYKYERWLIPATLVGGVILDSLTFSSIDIYTAFVLLGIYAFVAGGIILYMHAYDAKRISHHISSLRYIRLGAPLIIQFSFGALLSASFIFYVFSGSILVSWPLLMVFVILMISNDVFREYYLRFSVQIAVYFFILFSLLTIILPFVFHSIAPWIFALGGLLSVALIGGYLWVFAKIRREKVLQYRSTIISIAVVFACLNILYVANLMPPVPLAIRESVLAYDIRRESGAYVLDVPQQVWWKQWWPIQHFDKVSTEPLYLFTSIYAPNDLQAGIVHHWKWYNEQTEQWETKNKLRFSISGGRNDGYRGFSLKRNVPEGHWRVDVETERGQVLGRIRFRVMHTDSQSISIQKIY